jgi:hypothetical protein
MQINIKETGSDFGAGFSKKLLRDNFPFSIVDPFEVQRNPGCTVYVNSIEHTNIMAKFKLALKKFNEDTNYKFNLETESK